MPSPEDPRNGRDFSIKEILTDFVIPRLESIDHKLDGKADASAVTSLQMRMETLERQFVTRDEKHKMENDIRGLTLLAAQREGLPNDVEELDRRMLKVETTKAEKADVEPLTRFRLAFPSVTFISCLATVSLVIFTIVTHH